MEQPDLQDTYSDILPTLEKGFEYIKGKFEEGSTYYDYMDMGFFEGSLNYFRKLKPDSGEKELVLELICFKRCLFYEHYVEHLKEKKQTNDVRREIQILERLLETAWNPDWQTAWATRNQEWLRDNGHTWMINVGS
mmetsp:Transcript_7985/g.9617  ORF Transcript_7985/g.9617 Transcript_7985/m.9617 type:complete len:136 (-) Transcript_7985:259-666(-)|eukprot:CAMPEP_0184011962 /NCGR_PEP_ID=MMETSP0954-20121128/4116_1 /TAXON_ID=627963 /ORGANISM="Aplanochytrium sp, Strain PBS07" /LENGTH=135 /DNA_ID=CAMNT_0026291833 /DNA_START=210 /DNA_END=617 /DNA_ORIENTATION=+